MVIEVKALSLEMAKKMADSAETKAIEKKINIAIAIILNSAVEIYSNGKRQRR